MIAAILRDVVKPGEKIAEIYLENVPDPEPDTGEVVVRLKTAALNRRDVYIRQGLYPKITAPSILGSDGAGMIVKLGEDVQGMEIGDEVIINPGLDWGDDPNRPGPGFSVLGMPTDGTYAEYIKISAKSVFPKPKHLTWEEAAALPLGGLTAYRAVVTKGRVKTGDTVIIPGIGGGVATFALQIAVAKGAKVYVTSSSNEKIEKAIKLGASGGVNYREQNWSKHLKELTGGADLLIDSIGGEVFPELISLANYGARIVSFGATLGPVKKVVMPRIFFKELTIKGTQLGSDKDFVELIGLYEKNKIKPVVDSVFSLEQVNDAHKKMESGSQFGKIVLSILS
ncbi:zinc-binding alcohol dehydrogenase/oxidoreductase [Neobacillus niacini]|uniref:zinc-binding dehydrogenase n=1 Tax=Neobacillus niacini TaxID=86668 RepID=UPI00277FB4F4|nr:zinc-binding dehydrogenase [Neobacillus niacini]MDQ1002201.1 zinc-binding alcohol dehydrogenase/oxidoreductase [Neobacillus niacini]